MIVLYAYVCVVIPSVCVCARFVCVVIAFVLNASLHSFGYMGVFAGVTQTKDDKHKILLWESVIFVRYTTEAP